MINKQCLDESNAIGLQTRLTLDYRLYKLGVISQEWLKVEVKLLQSANRKSYMPCRLAQQQMTLSDLEGPFHASHTISVVAELLGLTGRDVNTQDSQFPAREWEFITPHASHPTKISWNVNTG